MALIFAIVLAALLHLGFILFGGLIFPKATEEAVKTQEVELLGSDDVTEQEKQKEKPQEKPTETTEEIRSEDEEPPPDAAEMLRNLEINPMLAAAPALEEASLSSIADALRGLGTGSTEFGAESLTFAAGGRIGGTGKVGGLDQNLRDAFDLTDIDQSARPIFQSSPQYPTDMRGKKVEGIVTLVFVVDAGGKVVEPKVLTTSHASFSKPALTALKQWKFEPALKGGKRVASKTKVTIRFK